MLNAADAADAGLARPPRVIYQYAVKVIQGQIKPDDKPPFIGPGIYFTSVNVHNPWRHEVQYAVKLAVSGYEGRPGDNIPLFHIHSLGPDYATQYDREGFSQLLPLLPPFLEGYFVIESREELDVVGVYTGAADQDKCLGAMHMERVPARKIPMCKNYNKMDISTGVAQWQLTAVPDGSTSPMLIGPAQVLTPPPSPPPNWVIPTKPAQWLGTANSARSGKYIYELRFCLCWTFANAKIDLVLWADNQAQLLLNGSPTTPSDTVAGTAFQGPGLPVSIASGFVIGMNILTVVVKNTEGPTGMLLSGTLSARAADCAT